jgi:hypothetical protein
LNATKKQIYATAFFIYLIIVGVRLISEFYFAIFGATGLVAEKIR